MSGKLGDYLRLAAQAQAKRIHITKAQQKEIAAMYEQIAKDLERQLKKHSDKSLSYRWLKDYAKTLRKESEELFAKIDGTVAKAALSTAKAVTDAQAKFYGGLCAELSGKFSDVFSNIPQQVTNELMNGGIYKDFAGLSERIWAYQRQYNIDIGRMIERGILQQKSAIDLAKDLQMYLNPKAAKPWNWNAVYPGVSRVVDYNTQRLARTSVTHAYQLSFQRATKDNPFVEEYEWLSANGGRTCELCAARNGQHYSKSSVPLDHPNGMCTIVAVIPKSEKEIADELADWANGKYNQDLENWLNPVNKGGKLISNRILVNERYIAKSRTEQGILYSSTGKMLKMIAGTEDHVRIPADIKPMMKGQIFSHNHPNNSLPSPSDIYNLWQYQLSEMRAVTEKYGIYRIVQPEKWKQIPSGVKAIKDEYDVLLKRFLPGICRRINNGFLQKENADHLVQQLCIRRIIRKYGLNLEVIAWPKK